MDPVPVPRARRRRLVTDFLRPLAAWLAPGLVATAVMEACVGWPVSGFPWECVGVAAAPVWTFLYGAPSSDWWCQPATWAVVDAVSLALFAWILFSRSPRKTLWLALHGIVWWPLAAFFAFCYVVASC